jgi:hypothetical protein
MCEYDNTTLVRVKIASDLSCDGKEKWKEVQIDSCIASLVRSLQHSGIDMRGSCCGHGKRPGHIDLADGRGLIILSPEDNEKYLESGHLPERTV